jgi:hypothetical protein
MLSEKIDLSAFMIWLFSDIKNNANLMKQNPTYQQKFINQCVVSSE